MLSSFSVSVCDMFAKDAKQLGMLPLILLLLGAQAIGSRTLHRCGLVLEMDALGVPRDQLARWAYLAEIKSSYQTDAVSLPDGNGQRYYGLFQIGDAYWCQSGYTSSRNICGVNCNDLISDNIGAIVKCSQQILSTEGWAPWGGDSQPYPPPETIDNCFEEPVNGTEEFDSSRKSNPLNQACKLGLQAEFKGEFL